MRRTTRLFLRHRKREVRFIDDITACQDCAFAHPLHPLDFAVDRYRFQFEIIASYLTGFLISGIGFGPIVAADSRSAAFGGCGRTAAAVVAAASKAIATNAVIVR
jgi:hypothetical protein